MKLYSRLQAILALFVVHYFLLLTYSSVGVGASAATRSFVLGTHLHLNGDSQLPAAAGTSAFGQRKLLNLSGSSEPSAYSSAGSGRRKLQDVDLGVEYESATTVTAKSWQRRLLNLSGSSVPSTPATIGNRRRLLNLSGSSVPSTETIGTRRRLLNLSGSSVPSTIGTTGNRRRLLNFSGSSEPSSPDSTGQRRRLLHLSESSKAAGTVPKIGLRRFLSRSAELIEQGCRPVGLLKAKGFQEYLYTDHETWTLVNATADLFRHGVKVGLHYFLTQPDAHGGQLTLEMFSPSNVVTMTTVAEMDLSPSTVPWLLMRTTSSSGSLSQFGGVQYVQRLFPQNGLPPVRPYSGQMGEIYRSPFTAEYAFYVAPGNTKLLRETAQEQLS